MAEPVLTEEAWHEFSDLAITEMDREFGRADRYFPAIPKQWSGDYSAAYQKLNQDWGDVDDLATELIDGSSRDLAKLDSLWDDFTHSLIVLELHNSRWEGVFQARADMFALLLSKAFAAFMSARAKATIERLERNLKALKKRLEEAKDDVTEAKWQLGINLTLNAIEIGLSFIPVIGPVVSLGASFAFDAISDAADDRLGPSKVPKSIDVSYYDSGGKLATVAEGLAEKKEMVKAEKFARQAGRGLGVLELAGTASNDLDEVDRAKAIVKELKNRIADAERERRSVTVLLDAVTVAQLRRLQAAAALLRSRLERAMKQDNYFNDEIKRLEKERNYRAPSSKLPEGAKHSRAMPTRGRSILGLDPAFAEIPPVGTHRRRPRVLA